VIVAANVDEFNDIVSKCPRRSLRWGKALQSRARSFAHAPLSKRNEVTSAAVNRTSQELALGRAADLPLGVELRRPQQLTRGYPPIPELRSIRGGLRYTQGGETKCQLAASLGE